MVLLEARKDLAKPIFITTTRIYLFHTRSDEKLNRREKNTCLGDVESRKYPCSSYFGIAAV
jgi:hypothetical protein